MPTQQDLDSILSQLKQLTPDELRILKREIDLIISPQEDSIIDVAEAVTYEALLRPIQQPQELQETLAVILKSLLDSVENPREKNDEVQIEDSAQKSPRPLGIWKGQVEVSDNFYQTSSDILSEFGIG
ncbi:hypothetical protein [Nostoc parmelioides]|uniref:DUF2281 domain-containing protein n=1 Tax=Nostoc parmelioides FACHB-3921 TaxID=2692909 RepID=A0ABR8BNY3_9NOSO|nr:hypothetical protein [Nostoc parmelioides]MBD2254962.1 hypothetical protein [Nostoc parmelioides FACHB-3921]